VAGFAGVLAAALFLGAFDGGPAQARARGSRAVAAAPSAPGLCFKGPGGKLLDFALRSGLPLRTARAGLMALLTPFPESNHGRRDVQFSSPRPE
jgi:hypothetical protein